MSTLKVVLGLGALATIIALSRKKVSVSDKRLKLIEWIQNNGSESEILTLVPKFKIMTESEINLLYDVIVLEKYGPLGSAIGIKMPAIIRQQYEALTSKYNIFT